MATSPYPTISPGNPGPGFRGPPGVIRGPVPIGVPANDIARRKILRDIAKNAAKKLGYIGAAYSVYELYKYLSGKKEGGISLIPGAACPGKTGVGLFTEWYHPTWRPCMINQANNASPIESRYIAPYYVEWTSADEFGHKDMAQHYDNPDYPSAPSSDPDEEPIWEPYIHPGYDPYPFSPPGHVPSPVAPPVPLPTTFPAHPDRPRQPERGPLKNPDPLIPTHPIPATTAPPLARPTLDFTPSPGASPGTLAPPTGNPTPPGRGVRERKEKFGSQAWYQFFDTILHYFTETQDFVKAWYDALPDKAKRCHRFATKCQTQAIFDNIEDLNVNEALKNLVLNEIEDTLIGKFNKALAEGHISTETYEWLVKMRQTLRDLDDYQRDLEEEAEKERQKQEDA